MKYYTAAAQVGHADANYNLGIMYHQDDGIAKDVKLALKYYTAAAQAGDADANYNLGIMYHQGDGVAKDVTLLHSRI